MFVLFWAIVHIAAAHESVTCFQDNQGCEGSDQNLVNTSIVPNWQECSQLCLDTYNCYAFTFYGPESDLIPHNSCFHFSSCESKAPCNDCVIGTPEDECFCSISYLGTIDESNFVTYLFDLDEATCKRHCSEIDACKVYTHYDHSDPNEPDACILLSESGLQKNATQCDHCKTGAAACKYDQECQAAVLVDTNGTVFNDYIFAESSFNATLTSAVKDCYKEFQALAIGAGGGGGGRGGGGSGYIVVDTLQIRRHMEVIVGQGGENEYHSGGESMIKIDDQPRPALRGFAGETANQRGGQGYSGGGYRDGNGGEDGGDGESDSNGPGGRGSGIDLSTMQMKSFVLDAARGGKSSGGYGGGGGGVLVNGYPVFADNSSLGGGYGGGGSYVEEEGGYTNGRPGCVLIDL